MATSTNKKASAQSDSVEESSTRRKTDEAQSSLEQIQGILFGEKVDEIESRLDQIENRIHGRLDKLSRDLNTQIGNLRDEVKVKTDRLNDGNEELGRTIASVDGALLDQHKHMTVLIASSTQEVSDELRRAIEDLEARKVDGALLSAFLTETSKNIAPA